jgi:hypothetical protein
MSFLFGSDPKGLTGFIPDQVLSSSLYPKVKKCCTALQQRLVEDLPQTDGKTKVKKRGEEEKKRKRTPRDVEAWVAKYRESKRPDPDRFFFKREKKDRWDKLKRRAVRRLRRLVAARRQTDAPTLADVSAGPFYEIMAHLPLKEKIRTILTFTESTEINSKKFLSLFRQLMMNPKFFVDFALMSHFKDVAYIDPVTHNKEYLGKLINWAASDKNIRWIRELLNDYDTTKGLIEYHQKRGTLLTVWEGEFLKGKRSQIGEFRKKPSKYGNYLFLDSKGKHITTVNCDYVFSSPRVFYDTIIDTITELNFEKIIRSGGDAHIDQITPMISNCKQWLKGKLKEVQPKEFYTNPKKEYYSRFYDILNGDPMKYYIFDRSNFYRRFNLYILDNNRRVSIKNILKVDIFWLEFDEVIRTEIEAKTYVNMLSLPNLHHLLIEDKIPYDINLWRSIRLYSPVSTFEDCKMRIRTVANILNMKLPIQISSREMFDEIFARDLYDYGLISTTHAIVEMINYLRSNNIIQIYRDVVQEVNSDIVDIFKLQRERIYKYFPEHLYSSLVYDSNLTETRKRFLIFITRKPEFEYYALTKKLSEATQEKREKEAFLWGGRKMVRNLFKNVILIQQ